MPHAPQTPRAFRFMPVTRDSDLRWGELVRDWILEVTPRPNNLDELFEQCDDRQISYDFPEEGLSQTIHFLQKGRDEVTIRLPARALFELGRDRIRQGLKTYSFPLFYNDFFEGGFVQHLRPIDDVEERLKLHSARTGEYAINGCA